MDQSAKSPRGVSEKKQDQARSNYKLEIDKVSTCKALLRKVTCGKLKRVCLDENVLERMFRKGRSKIDKDVNIAEIIRNQKVFLAALSSLMGRKKIEQISRDYYFGYVTSGDEPEEEDPYRSVNKQRTLEEYDAAINAIELKPYPVTPTAIINMSKSAKNRRKTISMGNKGTQDIDSSRAALQNDIGSNPVKKSKTYTNLYQAGTDREQA